MIGSDEPKIILILTSFHNILKPTSIRLKWMDEKCQKNLP